MKKQKNIGNTSAAHFNANPPSPLKRGRVLQCTHVGDCHGRSSLAVTERAAERSFTVSLGKPQQERQSTPERVMLNSRPEPVEGQHPRYENKTKIVPLVLPLVHPVKRLLHIRAMS